MGTIANASFARTNRAAIKSIVLALDLSLSCTGYAVLGLDSRGRPYVLTKGHIKTSPKKGTGGRLDQIASVLASLLSEYPKIEVVVRERGFSRFPKTTQALFRVVGVSDLVAFRHGHGEIIEIPPKKIKELIGGTGSADKKDVQAGVKRWIGELEFDTDDESDAVAVGLAYYLMNGLVT